MAPVPVQSRKVEDKPTQDISSPANLPIIASSDEEDLSQEGYQPLPQESDNIESDGNYDDEEPTLDGLLNALNTHGVNVISAEGETPSSIGDDDLEENATLKDTPIPNNVDVSSLDTEYNKEQNEIWSSSTSNEIILDEEKRIQIKQAMSAIKLPSSAVPTWATHLSDNELTNHINLMVTKSLPKSKD